MKIRLGASSSDKLVLCNLQRKLGEVVAVTGDGTNDAPALKDADVGFALASGTEIAKEACDIVILDDNIKSMAKAVLWGRNVYQSIRKFLQFQLVVNVVAVSLNLLAAIGGIDELPLAAVPLLWVNMIMDSMGALALATEPPSPQLMKRKPFGRTAPLINKPMWRNIIGISVYQLIVCIVFMFKGKDLLDIKCPYVAATATTAAHYDCHHQTLELNGFIFNTFVMMPSESTAVGSAISMCSRTFTNPPSSRHHRATAGMQTCSLKRRRYCRRSCHRFRGSDPETVAHLDDPRCCSPCRYLTRFLPLQWFPGVTDEESERRGDEGGDERVARLNLVAQTQ